LQSQGASYINTWLKQFAVNFGSPQRELARLIPGGLWSYDPQRQPPVLPQTRQPEPKHFDLPLSSEDGGRVLRTARQEPDAAEPGFQLAKPHGYSDR